MDANQTAFLTRLRETFRVEAAEHLSAVTAGLLALERATGADTAPLLEKVFRETHSLKGAAHSVRLSGVEVLCAELESVFAALRTGQLALSSALLDSVLPALEVVAVQCANPGAPCSSEVKERESRVLEAVRGLLRGHEVSAGGPEGGPSRPGPAQETDRAVPAAAAQPERNARAVGPASLPVLTRRQPGQPASSAHPGPHPAGTPREARAQGGDASPPPEPGPLGASETVRVSTHKLGALLTQAEELVGAKLVAGQHAAELAGLSAEVTRWNRTRLREVRGRRGPKDPASAELLESESLMTRSAEDSLRKLARSAQQHARALAGLADGLLEDVKKALLLPCSYLLGAFPVLVRELAREQKKQAELVVRGEDLEIDRRVLDELKDPLTHLVRNAVDHGLEPPEVRRRRGKSDCGRLTVTVTAAQGNRVELTVEDDGAGLDVERIRKAALALGLVSPGEDPHAGVAELVFHSGLSTSPIITELSGRGLGLAIVREKVERLGGTVTVGFTPGAGTRFRLLVPLSLSTFRAVFVGVAGRHFALPTASVVRVARVKPDEVRTVENRETVSLGGCPTSLVSLREVLELAGPRAPGGCLPRPVAIVRAGGREVAFEVDEVLGEHEVLVKGLGGQFLRVRNVAGACLSTSGTVVPILNPLDLLESARTAGAPRPESGPEAPAPARRARILLAEDSITSRTLVKSILESAGYEVVAAVDGLDALTALKTGEFDLVVSDVDMPRLNGFELTTRIRGDRKLAELPVVLVTALGSQKDREYGIEVGANAYLVKSDFDQSNLLELVRRLL